VFFLADGAPSDSVDWKQAFDELVDSDWPQRPYVITFGFGKANADVLGRSRRRRRSSPSRTRTRETLSSRC
jgi:hypothetical protein